MFRFTIKSQLYMKAVTVLANKQTKEEEGRREKKEGEGGRKEKSSHQ